MKNLLLSLTLFLAVPALAAEGTPINETRPLAPDGRLTVINVSGLVEVKAWGKNEVQVTGTLGAGTEKLDISGGRENLRIEVVLPKRGRNVEGSQLYLKVPEGAQVELKGVSADLSLAGTRGAARLTTVSGDVTVDAPLRELRVESVSGDLKIKAPSAETRLEVVSGDIQAENLTGALRVESVSGDIEVSGSGFSRIDAESVSGDIDIRADSLAAGVEIEADTVSGRLKLTLPGNLNAAVAMDTYSGDLRSDFGPPTRKTRDRWEATLGDGKGRIRLESHSGDISLTKR